MKRLLYSIVWELGIVACMMIGMWMVAIYFLVSAIIALTLQ
ncbi:MAG: hypothetical protein ACPKOP_11930 [Sphaerochaetaceae bacterium]